MSATHSRDVFVARMGLGASAGAIIGFRKGRGDEAAD